MEFEIRLSGAVEVRAAGRRGDLRSTKTRLTLAALAWDAGRTVSVDTLIHRVWDDHPPGKAREALHAHVSRVRASLRIAGSDAPPITSRTNSYVLQVDPDRVDLRCYQSCVHQARALRDSDDQEAALRLLDRADGLWRGEPLAGIAGSWAEHLRTAVGETSLAAAMTRTEILLGEGRFADAVPVLLPLAEEHPVDEALAERLAIALYGCNRTAEATRLLQRTRQRVVRDIGLDAGRCLHRVHQGILSGTPAADLLRRTGADEKKPARPARQVPDNLPRDVPWVGRREELRRLTSALCEGQGSPGVVVTVEAIDGMGGVGKTALAVHLGHRLRDRFPDGRIFLHLGGAHPDRTVTAPARALTELLRLTGLDAKELPHDTDELVALWRATARDRRMLVILDDAAGSDQVRPLLPGASPAAVIVTSRRRLPGLPGVRPVSLDVLPREDAMALFTRRLGVRPGTDESDIAEIVRMCGYLPLAIEIAASRLLARPSWGTSDLLRQLRTGGAHLAQLHDGERAMVRVFDLSYRALSAEQQLVFRRIGLHVGTEFTPHAVAALTGLSVPVAGRILEELLAHHLVSEKSPYRFTMHDLLRDYARSLMIEVGDVETEDDCRRAVRALVDHYVNTADRADRLAYPFRSRIADFTDVPVVSGPELADAQAAEQWLIAEGANLLDTLDWLAHHGTERQLAIAVHVLAGFLDMEGHVLAAEPLLRRAVAHWESAGDSAARARALLDLGAVHTHSSRYAEAIAAVTEALEAARDLGEWELRSECVHQLSIPLWQTGQYAQAQKLQKESLHFLLRTDNKRKIARSRNLLGILHLHLAENREALDCFTSALADFTEIGDDRGRYSTLNNIAELCQRMGDPEAAESAYREAMSVAEGMGNKRDRATLEMNLASVLDTLGKTEEALALYGRVLPVLRAVGDRRGEAIALNRIGRAHRAAGRGEEALPRHIAALAVIRRIHATGEEAEVLYDLALAERDTGRTEQAVAHLEESLTVSRSIGAPVEEARAARALAELRGTLNESVQ
ncbi:AfsR/SARP family transcriptional regulator [Streptomyces rubradiris]|uniref:SARP family transcriptional regulator n=1 Tax=Streptomyces rubradiris TaxID=285531 RepID=A0ABQ3RKQ9_STRRR|nr:tetratricopeptide repeat protein [Streptomyces rubradiris]GHH11270.1 SARP family transcriptional regulator [Streptomyces rubradiris]GHI56453.1 SARP family transcriptional regulator [Streptomyces rubradiris]